MRKYFSDYEDLIPWRALRNARSFRISYVGKYIGSNSNSYYRLFKITACTDEEGLLNFESVSFVTCFGKERCVSGMLERGGYKVYADYYDTFGGARLLYRYIKDMPFY